MAILLNKKGADCVPVGGAGENTLPFYDALLGSDSAFRMSPCPFELICGLFTWIVALNESFWNGSNSLVIFGNQNVMVSSFDWLDLFS